MWSKMPPAAIASSVTSTTSVAPRASRSSSADAGGNLGAEPKPPCSMSASSRSPFTAASTSSGPGSSWPGSTRPIAPSCERILFVASPIRSRWVAHDCTTASITIRKLGIPRRGSGGKYVPP
jgi:hypothetical protein